MTKTTPTLRALEGPPLTLIKFLVPLENDFLALPAALGFIDALCHRAALAHEIVAVDDASRDGTAAEARRFTHLMPVWLIEHGRPMGRAMAFRTALEAGCRDAVEDDLLMPLDPRRRPALEAALQAVSAARAGWQAVSFPAGRPSGRGQEENRTETVTVYHAGLIKRHLTGFLETPPAGDAGAVRQLEQYLRAVGVPFLRQEEPAPRVTIGHLTPGAGPAAAAGSRAR